MAINYHFLFQNPKQSADDRRKHRNLLLLSIAYSANIGGTGVITGSPPNLLVLSELPEESGVNFATWMGFCIPMMLVNLFMYWIWLTFIGVRLFGPGRKIINHEHEGKHINYNSGYVNYPIEQEEVRENTNVTNCIRSDQQLDMALKDLRHEEQPSVVSTESELASVGSAKQGREIGI